MEVFKISFKVEAVMLGWNIAHQYWLNEVFLKFLFYPLPCLLFFLFGLCLFSAAIKRLRGELEPHWPGLAKLSAFTVFWCVIFPLKDGYTAKMCFTCWAGLCSLASHAL